MLLKRRSYTFFFDDNNLSDVKLQNTGQNKTQENPLGCKCLPNSIEAHCMLFACMYLQLYEYLFSGVQRRLANLQACVCTEYSAWKDLRSYACVHY